MAKKTFSELYIYICMSHTKKKRYSMKHTYRNSFAAVLSAEVIDCNDVDNRAWWERVIWSRDTFITSFTGSYVSKTVTN